MLPPVAAAVMYTHTRDLPLPERAYLRAAGANGARHEPKKTTEERLWRGGRGQSSDTAVGPLSRAVSLRWLLLQRAFGGFEMGE